MTSLDLCVQELSSQVFELSLLDDEVGDDLLAWCGHLVAGLALLRLHAVRRVLGSNQASRTVEAGAQILSILDGRVTVSIDLLHEDVDVAGLAGIGAR